MDGAKVKEGQLPQEIIATVESLKQSIKNQKTISSDIARTSQRRLNHVGTECENLYHSLADLANSIEANGVSIKSLRSDTAETIQHAEMAQRTHETPAGLQFENTAPLLYFRDLVQRYENDLLVFRSQVEMTEKHMRSLAQPQPFTANDLKQGLRQIHESFIALAGRHHEIHQKVEAQKELYLKLRRFFLHDNRDVFEDGPSEVAKKNAGQVTMGPTPFSTLHIGNPAGLSQTTTNVQQGTAANITGGSSLFGNSSFGTTGAMFGSTTNNLSTGNAVVGTAGPFNLEKAPTLGNKRNKQTFFQ